MEGQVGLHVGVAVNDRRAPVVKEDSVGLTDTDVRLGTEYFQGYSPSIGSPPIRVTRWFAESYTIPSLARLDPTFPAAEVRFTQLPALKSQVS